ncbi:MAG: hypothetical protein JJT93_15835 [Gammaproteobacteria bacterium]|nr:hypothetical protein [Gammaproteobacteria bacterium]
MPMLTAFGDYGLASMKVWTEEMDESLREDEVLAALQNRSATEALVLDPFSSNTIA